MGPEPGQIQQYMNETFESTTTSKSTMESVSAFWLPSLPLAAGGGGGGTGGTGGIGTVGGGRGFGGSGGFGTSLA